MIFGIAIEPHSEDWYLTCDEEVFSEEEFHSEEIFAMRVAPIVDLKTTSFSLIEDWGDISSSSEELREKIIDFLKLNNLNISSWREVGSSWGEDFETYRGKLLQPTTISNIKYLEKVFKVII